MHLGEGLQSACSSVVSVVGWCHVQCSSPSFTVGSAPRLKTDLSFFGRGLMMEMEMEKDVSQNRDRPRGPMQCALVAGMAVAAAYHRGPWPTNPECMSKAVLDPPGHRRGSPYVHTLLVAPHC